MGHAIAMDGRAAAVSVGVKKVVRVSGKRLGRRARGGYQVATAGWIPERYTFAG